MQKWKIDVSKDNPKEAYYPGDTVTGNLLLDIDKPENYSQISIQLDGRAHVRWEKTQGKHTVVCESTDQFVNNEVTLWSGGDAPDAQLAPGHYSWPFSFEIPTRAASSHEGSDYGNIRYSLVGKARRKNGRVFGGRVRTVAEVRIAVLQLVKLTDPRLLRPVRQDIQRRFLCLFCAKRPITLTVSIPKTGYLLGESVRLRATVENATGRRLTVTAKLKQRVTYHARGNTRDDCKTYAKVTDGEIGRRTTKDWDATLEIPTSDVCVAHDSTCSIIKVDHYLKVTCHVPRAFSISVTVPLQLGNCVLQ